jgi:transcriptional regulator with XRE-family HTH domain
MLDSVNIKIVKVRTGDLVKLLRKREGLTQEQLAEKLGFSRLTIQNLESGKNATIDTLLKVLQHFELLNNLYEHLGNEIENNSQSSLY